MESFAKQICPIHHGSCKDVTRRQCEQGNAENEFLPARFRYWSLKVTAFPGRVSIHLVWLEVLCAQGIYRLTADDVM